jgi:hypothetical protein
MNCGKPRVRARGFLFGAGPPVVCLAEVGWYITSHERLAATRDFSLGSHGYDPDDPQMVAPFVAEGPAFGRARPCRPSTTWTCSRWRRGSSA